MKPGNPAKSRKQDAGAISKRRRAIQDFASTSGASRPTIKPNNSVPNQKQTWGTADKSRKLKSRSGHHADPTFTCFRMLPAELRRTIWGYASTVTRNVAITSVSLRNRIRFKVNDFEAKFWRSKSSPPALLHVCQESRIEGLKYYIWEFGTEMTVVKHGEYNTSFTVSTVPRIYFN